MEDSGGQVESNRKKEFICACGKEYLSNAALFTHVKQKHEGIAPGNLIKPSASRSRGRPKKLAKVRHNQSFIFIERPNIQDQLQVNYFSNFQHLKPKLAKNQKVSIENSSSLSKKNIKVGQSLREKMHQNNTEYLKHIFRNFTQEDRDTFQSLPYYTQFYIYEYLNNILDKETILYGFWIHLNQYLLQKFPQKEIQQTLLIIFLYLEYLYKTNKQKLMYNPLNCIAEEASRYVQQFLCVKIKELNLQKMFIFQREKPTEILVWLCCFMSSNEQKFLKQTEEESSNSKYT